MVALNDREPPKRLAQLKLVKQELGLIV